MFRGKSGNVDKTRRLNISVLEDHTLSMSFIIRYFRLDIPCSFYKKLLVRMPLLDYFQSWRCFAERAVTSTKPRRLNKSVLEDRTLSMSFVIRYSPRYYVFIF